MDLKLPEEEKLKRLIYLCNTDGKYCCGSPDKNKLARAKYVDILEKLLKSSEKELLNVLETAIADKYLPHKWQVFYILATLLTLEASNDKNKPKICEVAEKGVNCDKDIFAFIKAVTSTQQKDNKKPPKSVRKCVVRFYNNKTAEDLAKSYVVHKSYHGWKHKDIIKFFHVKSDTVEKNGVINYILHEKKKEPMEASKQLIELMQKANLLRTTTDPNIAVNLIIQLNATIKQVSPFLKKSDEVWNAVLPNMSLQDMLLCLPKLYKLGFLERDSPTLILVMEALMNSDKIKSSGVHPFEVFVHMKNFDKGGKPMDPKLLEHLKTEKNISDEEYEKLKTPKEVKSPLVMYALYKCMDISTHNVEAIGKKYLITIDATEKMDVLCLGCKNITGIEAAAAFAWFLLKAEKDVTVAVFKDKEIAVINLEKKAHLYEHVQILRERKSKFLLLASPIEWATNHKKHFDVFINFIHHKEYYATIPKDIRDKMVSPVDSLEKYRKKLKVPNAKLVTFCLSSPKMVVAQGQTNVLDIAGIDLAVPRVLEAFCRNHFT